jgi:hypothetical protein
MFSFFKNPCWGSNPGLHMLGKHFNTELYTLSFHVFLWNFFVCFS